MLISNRYLLLEPIATGGMGEVYRAHDRLTNDTIALKRVLTRPPVMAMGSMDTETFRLALAHEFKTMASLRHPNIISVLDYGFDDNHIPFYTMALLPDSQTIIEVAKDKPLDVQVSLVIQMLQALAYLHRRKVIHRDLKPANVLVQDGVVKVLDFGLAQSHQSGDAEQIGGTLAYIAPELLMGSPATERSDLYSVGIIAYEILAGRHPFETRNPSLLIRAIMDETPNVDILPVPDNVKDVVRILLSKDPLERFGSAVDLIEAYNAATGRQTSSENELTRESFLQAAQFIGRKAELATLFDALAQTEAGNGSAWLIGGESGVGKSRLLEELRIRALVEGVTVLRGQAVAQGGTPYRLWREVLRWLAMSTELTDLEAGVLKGIVPDIGVVLGRDVSFPTQLDSQGAQQRLLSVIEAVFRKQTQPLMLILEDLHWSKGGLDILAHLTRIVSQFPLLLVGTFRDDETPDLPKRLTGMNLMRLGRLDEDSIAALCESMLGSAGRSPAVVELAQRETEGNVFFLIEVIRALAEETGELATIGSTTLPQSVFRGGMKMIVQRRLSRVPVDAYPLLELVALYGRRLNIPLVRYLAPQADLEAWLTICSDAAILDVMDERWQFTHDKIREGLIESIEPERRTQLHQQVAEGLERVYPNAPEQYSNLAYHWRMAKNPTKELHYTILAGEEAMRLGANEQAVELLERALALSDENRLQRALLNQLLGDALYGLGRLHEAKDRAKEALKLAGHPMPDSKVVLGRKLITHLIRQGLHRAFPSLFIGRERERERVLLAARAYERAAIVDYMLSDTLGLALATVYSLNLAEKGGASAEMARTLVNFGTAIALVPPMQKPAEFYFEFAKTISVQYPESERWVQVVTGVFHLGMGHLSRCQAPLETSLRIAEQSGDPIASGESCTVLTMYYYNIGAFELGAAYARQSMEKSQHIGARNNYSAAIVGLCANLLRQSKGSIETEFAILEDILPQIADIGQTVVGSGSLALKYLRDGRIEPALEMARITTKIIHNTVATSYYTLVGYIHVIEVFLTLWERGHHEQYDNITKTQKALASYANAFPLGRPAKFRYEGWIAWLDGKQEQALKAWDKSLVLAESMGMSYEYARTCYEMARLLPATHIRQGILRQEARQRFMRLDAQYDLEQLEKLEKNQL